MLTIGDKLPEVKVKEINFFDLMPVLSYKDTVVKEENLNYHMIAPGAYLEVAIEKINEEHKYVTLRVNKFVRGNLHIENMADHPIKQMPPKLLEVGKKVRVRVLNVNVGKRFIEFTKKDSFMKDDAPVYQSYKEVKKGNKVICNVVSHCEHGVVVKSFGNIKGLITYEDIKAKENVSTVDEKQYKAGTVLKAYVLFKKADKGLALTMSKKKAKATGDDVSKDHYKTLENNFLPNEEEMEQILSNTKYSTMLKQSRDSELVGQVLTFRLLESPEDEERGFYIVKSLDAEKKSKNFIGLLPKCLVSNFACFSSSLINSSSTFKGLIIEIFRDNLPVVSIQPDLIALKSEIADKSKDEELTMTSGQSYIGICNGLHGMAGQVSVRFLNGVSKSIKVKDLNTTSNYESIYTPGKILRVAVNKLERLCTKQQVLRAALSS
jgi:thiol-disulfide isomerase/thioredoxin